MRVLIFCTHVCIQWRKCWRAGQDWPSFCRGLSRGTGEASQGCRGAGHGPRGTLDRRLLHASCRKSNKHLCSHCLVARSG